MGFYLQKFSKKKVTAMVMLRKDDLGGYLIYIRNELLFTPICI